MNDPFSACVLSKIDTFNCIARQIYKNSPFTEFVR